MLYQKHKMNKEGEACFSFKLTNGQTITTTDKDAAKLVKLVELMRYFNDKLLV